MRGVDTNVLVRFLVGDDATQSGRAAALFARASAGNERFFVPQIVACELVWVLRYAYDKDRSEIAAGLESLMRARQLVFEDTEQVRSALGRYAAGDGDLADWLIWERSRTAGAESVVTFDKRLLRAPEFVEV